MKAAGACFGDVNGWERPNWFAPPGVKPEYHYSYGRQNWFPYAQAEAEAVRDRVGLFDQSSFAKFSVEGRDALAVLNRLSTANVDVEPGRMVYTQWCNARGGIEADLTVTRLAEDRFLVVTGSAVQTRDFARLKEAIRPGEFCVATDITSGLPMLSVMGPNARALLQSITDDDLSNEAFPFATSREIELGYARVRASRITYVGELGWELYIPAEFAQGVYDVIMAAGEQQGLKLCGMHTMNNCRMEKGYRHWGHDIGDEDSPLEAGLGFTIAWDKPGGFVGLEALAKARQSNIRPKRMVAIALDDTSGRAPMMYHEEPIYRDGVLVGSTTSGAFGHRIGRSLALGYVKHKDGVTEDWLKSGSWEVEIAWQRHPATVQLKPFYDPTNARIRC
jgi:4-methylaminobutanoate oxidase (formaldehyde-forming)